MKTRTIKVFLLTSFITCFSLMPAREAAAQAFSVLKNFGSGYDGLSPNGLVLFGSGLFGTTGSTIFYMNTDGSGFEEASPFTNQDYDDSIGLETNNVGLGPNTGLVVWGLHPNILFGTTVGGGANGTGTVVLISGSTGDVSLRYTFSGLSDGWHGDNSDGAFPNGGMILSGDTLYGTTYEGGDYGYGTVFSVNIDGSDFTTLHSFHGYPGCNPVGGLAISTDGNTLYGTTTGGGVYNGTVFAVDTDGSGFVTLYDFGGDGINGWHPYGALIISGTTLYGTTVDGGNNPGGDAGENGQGYGTVFSLNIDTGDLTNVYWFNGSDGANPYGGLVLSESGNTLYGTTQYGGTNGYGTLFSVKTDSSDFSLLRTLGFYDGIEPTSTLILSGGTIYGTTPYGGNEDGEFGTVFSFILP